MIARKYRILIPNGLTFLSLLCGTCSILVSAAVPAAADAPRYLWVAGLLILTSYLIDWCMAWWRGSSTPVPRLGYSSIR